MTRNTGCLLHQDLGALARNTKMSLEARFSDRDSSLVSSRIINNTVSSVSASPRLYALLYWAELVTWCYGSIVETLRSVTSFRSRSRIATESPPHHDRFARGLARHVLQRQWGAMQRAPALLGTPSSAAFTINRSPRSTISMQPERYNLHRP
jgi:hypothetical protein